MRVIAHLAQLYILILISCEQWSLCDTPVNMLYVMGYMLDIKRTLEIGF